MKKHAFIDWLKSQIADEKKSNKMYQKKGFPNIAKDERKHARILGRKLKKVVS